MTHTYNGAMGHNRKKKVEYMGSDVFNFVSEPSQTEMLWQELFKEKERKLLRKQLVSRTVSFSIKETYQISLRMLWQPHARSKLHESISAVVSGPVAVLLPDREAPLDTSWAWSKLLLPLYERQFSVILVDLPCDVGNAHVLQGAALCDGWSSWTEMGSALLRKLLTHLNIEKAHFITVGESCNAVVHLLNSNGEKYLEMKHVFHNPVLDLKALFPLFPRQGARLTHHQMEEQRQKKFEKFWHTHQDYRFWATFDQQMVGRTLPTWKLLSEFSELPLACEQIRCTQLLPEHIYTAQVGTSVAIHLLFPCRYIKNSFVNFVAQKAYRPPTDLISQHQKGDTDEGESSPMGKMLTSGAASSNGTSSWPVDTSHSFGGVSFAMTRVPTNASVEVVRTASSPPSAAKLPSCCLPGNSASSNIVDIATWSPSSRAVSRTKSAKMTEARHVAAELQTPDPSPTRKRLLVNVPVVQNVTTYAEMREPLPKDEQMSAQERNWLEDSLDLSVATAHFEDEHRQLQASRRSIARQGSLSAWALDRELQRKMTMRNHSAPEAGPMYSRGATRSAPGLQLR